MRTYGKALDAATTRRQPVRASSCMAWRITSVRSTSKEYSARGLFSKTNLSRVSVTITYNPSLRPQTSRYTLNASKTDWSRSHQERYSTKTLLPESSYMLSSFSALLMVRDLARRRTGSRLSWKDCFASSPYLREISTDNSFISVFFIKLRLFEINYFSRQR